MRTTNNKVIVTKKEEEKKATAAEAKEEVKEVQETLQEDHPATEETKEVIKIEPIQECKVSAKTLPSTLIRRCIGMLTNAQVTQITLQAIGARAMQTATRTGQIINQRLPLTKVSYTTEKITLKGRIREGDEFKETEETQELDLFKVIIIAERELAKEDLVQRKRASPPFKGQQANKGQARSRSNQNRNRRQEKQSSSDQDETQVKQQKMPRKQPAKKPMNRPRRDEYEIENSRSAPYRGPPRNFRGGMGRPLNDRSMNRDGGRPFYPVYGGKPSMGQGRYYEDQPRGAPVKRGPIRYSDNNEDSVYQGRGNFRGGQRQVGVRNMRQEAY
jgi:hypothetical protein